MTQATSGAPDVQGFLVGGATVAAVATVGLAVLSGLRRRKAIYRHMP